jgi:hypothetical protein
MNEPKVARYQVIYDYGKPWSEYYASDEDLEAGLRRFFEAHKSEDGYYDAKVYDVEGNDLSEEQFVAEIVAKIMEE